MVEAAWRIAPHVEAALARGAGVVALESTIIAHGLPFPDNLAIACELEDAVSEAGAVPATIAILDGVPTVGLDREQLERVARTGREHMAKTSAVDMAHYMARGSSAATTVSATAELAVRAGIRVFATGGIGGVHRGETGDVSHDLVTLSRAPLTVVSAGAKAILDLGRTLEMLETLGVLVLGFQTREWPAFYTRRSGFALEHRVDAPEDVARIMRVRFDQLESRAGILLANPIPEHAALDPARIDQAIGHALEHAARDGVVGKALTPFLLGRLAESTGGESVTANRALARNNAALAGRVARAYAGREP